ncbi:glycerophosphodiester phosphodiesterase family protein [Haloferula sp.]|uniref:glycerophosphodiester phosphodiesterase family protein n=1 Tax=Haloferula sp. TaxID=2497595 RepID=UPI00329B3794
MPEPKSRNDGLWRHYWATWRTMFAIQTMTLILGLSIAIPIVSLAISRALIGSKDAVICDTDLLDFLAGPSFPLILIAVAALWIIIHVFGYAAQLFTAHASFHGAPFTVFTAIRKTGRSFIPLTRLASRFFLQLFIVALPFLLVIVGVLSLQLQDHDLSHYLTERPPEFILAVAFAAAVLAGMIIILLRITVRWALALPLVLFHGENPTAARRLSRKKFRPIRNRIFFTFSIWTVGTPLLILILNAGWLPLALRASGLLGHRLGLLALILSVLIFVTLGIAVLVGFINLTFLALQHVRLYRSAGLDSDDPPTSPDPVVSKPIRGIIVASVIVAGLLTTGLSYRWLDGLRIADHAQVIAHRGASTDAPENTVAAMLRAVDHGADTIAVDVRQRANMELMVFADSDFTRIAGNPLKLSEATEEDLAAIDIGSWMHKRFNEERVPTLTQVTRLCGDRTNLMLHLPDIANEKERSALINKVIETVELAGVGKRTRFVCARSEHVPAIRALRPDWQVGFWSPVMIDGPIGTPVSFVIVPAMTLRDDLINNLHRQGIEVFAAETSDPVVMSAVLSRGADGLLIPAPGIGRKVIEERANLNPGERLLVEFITRIRDTLPKSSTRTSLSP